MNSSVPLVGRHDRVTPGCVLYRPSGKGTAEEEVLNDVPELFIQGSCAGLEYKANLEKSLNFIKLKKSLNCFGKRVEGLEKFEICLCETFNKTW